MRTPKVAAAIGAALIISFSSAASAFAGGVASMPTAQNDGSAETDARAWDPDNGGNPQGCMDNVNQNSVNACHNPDSSLPVVDDEDQPLVDAVQPGPLPVVIPTHPIEELPPVVDPGEQWPGGSGPDAGLGLDMNANDPSFNMPLAVDPITPPIGTPPEGCQYVSDGLGNIVLICPNVPEGNMPTVPVLPGPDTVTPEVPTCIPVTDGHGNISYICPGPGTLTPELPGNCFPMSDGQGNVIWLCPEVPEILDPAPIPPTGPDTPTPEVPTCIPVTDGHGNTFWVCPPEGLLPEIPVQGCELTEENGAWVMVCPGSPNPVPVYPIGPGLPTLPPGGVMPIFPILPPTVDPETPTVDPETPTPEVPETVTPNPETPENNDHLSNTGVPLLGIGVALAALAGGGGLLLNRRETDSK